MDRRMEGYLERWKDEYLYGMMDGLRDDSVLVLARMDGNSAR